MTPALPTWCVICDERHVPGRGVVCPDCLAEELRRVAL